MVVSPAETDAEFHILDEETFGMGDRRSRSADLEDHGCSPGMISLINSFSPECQAIARSLLGIPVRDEAAEQRNREWLDAICPERAPHVAAEDQSGERVLSPLARSFSPECQAIARSLLGIPEPDAAAESPSVREGSWDAAKHPRGGFSQNPGWFSPAGGPGGASEPRVGPTHGHDPATGLGGFQPHFQTVGHKTPQLAPGTHALPRGDIYLCKTKMRRIR